MEDMLWKFPHIGENIFKKLSNKNLAKCKKVSRSWEYFITNEKFYKQRVHYEMKQKEKLMFGDTPLHEAARDGQLLECKLIIDHVEDKNPQDDYGRTPLHFAAENGHLSVCQLIVDNVQNKNPKNEYERTPLDWAISVGCNQIIEYLKSVI